MDKRESDAREVLARVGRFPSGGDVPFDVVIRAMLAFADTRPAADLEAQREQLARALHQHDVDVYGLPGWDETPDAHDYRRAQADVAFSVVAADLEAVREACAQACEDERVDADATGDEGDALYNRGIDDCTAAIRALDLSAIAGER